MVEDGRTFRRFGTVGGLAMTVAGFASDRVHKRIVTFLAYHVRQDTTTGVDEPVAHLLSRQER